MENLSQMTEKFKDFLLDSSQDMFECDKQCKQYGTAAGVIKIPNLAENGAEYALYITPYENSVRNVLILLGM